MKRLILLTILLTATAGCTEKSQVALKVAQDKIDNKMLEAAGEGEAVIEMYRLQYATFKERLVRLKTIKAVMEEELDHAYAKIDDRRTKLYTDQVTRLNEKIPMAENTLREFYEIFEQQKQEIKLLKDQTATYKAMGMMSDDLNVVGAHEHRADTIKMLTAKLKERAQRAKSILEVNDFEEKFISKSSTGS
jgi:hypothetical protein